MLLSQTRNMKSAGHKNNSKMEMSDVGNCDQRRKRKTKSQSDVSKESNDKNRSRSIEDEVSGHRKCTKTRGSSKGTKVSHVNSNKDSMKSDRGSETQRERSKMKKNKVTENEMDDDDDCNFDFSVIESKIFEGFNVQENSKAKVQDTRTKRTDRKISDESPKNEKGSATRKSRERKKTPEEKEVSSRSHSKSSRKDKNGQQLAPKPSSSKQKAEHTTVPRTPVDKKRPSKGRSSQKKSAKVESDSDLSDWEEVEERNEVTEMEELLSGSQPSVASGGNVQIELDAPNVLWGIKRRKRRTEEEMVRIVWSFFFFFMAKLCFMFLIHMKKYLYEDIQIGFFLLLYIVGYCLCPVNNDLHNTSMTH